MRMFPAALQLGDRPSCWASSFLPAPQLSLLFGNFRWNLSRPLQSAHGCVLTRHTVAAKKMYQTVVNVTPLTPGNGDVDPVGLGPPQTWASEA